MTKLPGCPLCDAPGGEPVFECAQFRVIRANETGFPGFYRLVWQAHVAEFSDLSPADRALCMEAVALAEACMREHLSPDKMNLATLGNVVPHLHWHLIARYGWDSHFPAPVWAQAQREAPPDLVAAIEALLPALDRDLAARLAALPGKRAAS